ncbi:MAG TPA: hypothetical protein VFT12_04735 [Thermoanaerobaculia bacterium]|nr:hypothetical protein [Thermoanaerobaculia bacterium]
MRQVAALVLVLSSAACLRAADPVDAELARLETAAAALDASKLNEQIQNMVTAARERVALAQRTDDPLLQLYRLRDAYLATETLAWVAAHSAPDQQIAHVETLWNREKPRFAAQKATIHATLVRGALAEAATNRAAKLSKASLPYARVSSPFSGIYYLGEASANLRFAQFIDSLPPVKAERERRPAREALSASADALETEMLGFFANDPTNRAAIPVSAKFKEMRELLDAGAIDGATLLLLETRLELSRRQANAEAKTAVPPDRPLDSMAALWQAVAAADDKGATRQIVHTAVLPLYDAILRGSK